MKPPGGLGSSGVGKRGEREHQFDDEPVGKESANRLPHEVAGQVRGLARPGRAVEVRAGRIAKLDEHTVRLDPERVDAEDKGTAIIALGGQQELHLIVIGDLVSPGPRGHNACGITPRPNPDMQGIVRVPEADLGRVSRRITVHGGVLPESPEHDGVTPHRFIEPTIQGHDGLAIRNDDGVGGRGTVERAVGAAPEKGRAQRQEDDHGVVVRDEAEPRVHRPLSTPARVGSMSAPPHLIAIRPCGLPMAEDAAAFVLPECCSRGPCPVVRPRVPPADSRQAWRFVTLRQPLAVHGVASLIICRSRGTDLPLACPPGARRAPVALGFKEPPWTLPVPRSRTVGARS